MKRSKNVPLSLVPSNFHSSCGNIIQGSSAVHYLSMPILRNDKNKWQEDVTYHVVTDNKYIIIWPLTRANVWFQKIARLQNLPWLSDVVSKQGII